jgi:hypothetical protein
MDPPLVRQLSVQQLKHLSGLGPHPEALSAWDTPLRFNLLYFQAPALPAQRKRALGILVARMALDQRAIRAG